MAARKTDSETFYLICAPISLGLLIRYFSGVQGYTDTWGYVLAVLIVLFNVGVFAAHHPYFYVVQCIGMQIRIASCALIYRKALRLSTNALGDTTVGQLVNLLSNDVSRFDTSVMLAHYLWIGPTQTLISTAFLWYEIGPSCLAGIFLIILFVPLQSYMGKVFAKLRLATAIQTDERVRIMNEMINAIRVIKMYAWERPFSLVVEKARNLEIDIIMKSNYFRAINLALFSSSSKIVLFPTLLIYVFAGNVLTAEKVFVTSSLVNNIRLAMTLFFPFAISMGSETLISCRRIQTFLEMEEKDECNKALSSNLRQKLKNCIVEGRSIYARWDPKSGEDDLRDVSFSVKTGEILSLIGPVGSGKSSLLQVVLSELPIKEGSIDVKGKISYASQEPWLFCGSVRDNILFGQPYDAKRYRNVIKVCALERDLELFPERDQTSVGERGVSLSGGQKARINLARAVYFEADIYLLDDPLSAVDAHVGKHLFEQCISGFLRHKVVILATHQLQFIRTTSKILILRNGHVETQGTYKEMKNKGIDFFEIVGEEAEESEPCPVPRAMNVRRGRALLTRATSLKKIDSLVSRTTSLRRASEAWSALHGITNDPPETGFDNNSSTASSALGGSVLLLFQEDIYAEEEEEKTIDGKIKPKSVETKSVGSVSFSVYMHYFLTGGGMAVFLFWMVLNILAQLLFTGSDYWLSYWSNMEQLYGQLILDGNLSSKDFEDTTANKTGIFIPYDRFFYVYIYTGITLLLVAIALVRAIIFFRMCMTSSKNLHNRMFSAVLRVPMHFFETHPIGQILNRFTKDTGQVDDLLPPAMYDFITITFTFLGIVGMILYINIWILLPTVLLSFMFIFVRWVYISSARDIKRLEGIVRSPVFSHLSSTFEGLPTIRAFGAQSTCASQFDVLQDVHTSAWYLFIATSRIFGIYLDLLSTIYIAAVTFSFMLSKDALGGDVGLGISLAMMLSGMLQWGVRQSTEVENHMTSVERILEYSKLSPEVSNDVELLPKEKGWPREGKITFEKVYLYYSKEEPPVLKNLSFTIEPTEKIGIVGRTGAGKSSLLACLFRLTPLQGNIIIDKVSTDTIQLEDLRKSLSIIPQDPTLFKGTVRYNLDPFSNYSDEQIWSALEEVHLKESVVEMSGGLDTQISEGGSNLSSGQRQLLCLARAILKHNKILVMDEATANVDPETDNWIQRTIREKFTDCTVLTIAHRLQTIMDSDKAMVMDSGFLKEFGTPFELLKDPQSIFSELVNQTGPVTSQQLRNIAKTTYFKKTNPLSSAIFKAQRRRASEASRSRRSDSIEEDDEKMECTKF